MKVKIQPLEPLVRESGLIVRPSRTLQVIQNTLNSVPFLPSTVTLSDESMSV